MRADICGMTPLDFWRALSAELQAGRPTVLVHVVESMGSSPGRAGFRLFVRADGSLCGSIGGGSMEHKLVELVRSLHGKPEAFPFLKRQVHRSDAPAERSGMICSGEQSMAFLRLTAADASAIDHLVQALEAGRSTVLHLHPQGLSVGEQAQELGFRQNSGSDWGYRERIAFAEHVLIIGGGHVGMALSRTMAQLGFHVHQMDDRPALNTMEANVHAHQRTVTDYTAVGTLIADDPSLYVVLVSFGYRTDDVLLRQLVRKRFKYLGMLGSAEKVKRLFAGMLADGWTAEELARVRAPIGLPINSRTPEEIAVSIAAEIVQVKNAP